MNSHNEFFSKKHKNFLIAAKNANKNSKRAFFQNFFRKTLVIVGLSLLVFTGQNCTESKVNLEEIAGSTLPSTSPTNAIQDFPVNVTPIFEGDLATVEISFPSTLDKNITLDWALNPLPGAEPDSIDGHFETKSGVETASLVFILTHENKMILQLPSKFDGFGTQSESKYELSLYIHEYDIQTKTEISVTEKTPPLAKVSGGDDHSCFVAAGEFACLGGNGSGELGDGGSDNASKARRNPFVAAQQLDVREVASTSEANCFIDALGSAYCFGQNDFGEVGNGTTSTQRVPTLILDGSVNKATRIDGGRHHYCAVVNGGVMCWGRNNNNQVSSVAEPIFETPQEVFPPNSGATAVSAGDDHSCALIKGEVYCWGDNSFGQIGSTLPSSPTPFKVNGLSNKVSLVKSGRFHNCALDDNVLKCWGLNDELQLGLSANVPQINTATAQPDLESSKIFDISMGISHTCAHLANRQTKCWGANDTRQIAQNANVFPVGTETPQNVAPLDGFRVSSLGSGENHQCALLAASGLQSGLEELVCWGNNSTGQIGIGVVGGELDTPFAVLFE